MRQATTRISGPETVTQSSGIETIHMEAERRLVKKKLYVRSGCDTYGGTKKTCKKNCICKVRLRYTWRQIEDL